MAKKKNRVVIIVEGGIVRDVAVDNKNSEVIIIDYDDVTDDPEAFADGFSRRGASLGKTEVDRLLREAKAQLKRLLREVRG